MKKIKLAAINTKYLLRPSETHDENEKNSLETAYDYINKNIQKSLDWMNEAGKEKVDLVCTVEDFATMAMNKPAGKINPGLFKEIVVKTSAEIEDKVAVIAKNHNMLIAANFYKCDDDKIYNTTSLFGRDGKIIGKYRKVHLPIGERWVASPGSEYPVFETDIGRIGFSICYDIAFPEVFRCLALNGADIIVHQTVGWAMTGKSNENTIVGEAFMRVRAAENFVYLVVSKHIGIEGEKSLIVDNGGNIVAESSELAESLVTAEIEPNYDMTDKYYLNNYFADLTSTRALMMLERMPETYNLIMEKSPPVMNRYTGMELCSEPAKYERIMSGLGEMTREEYAKYHW